jgi:hypothetical protein
MVTRRPASLSHFLIIYTRFHIFMFEDIYGAFRILIFVN